MDNRDFENYTAPAEQETVIEELKPIQPQAHIKKEKKAISYKKTILIVACIAIVFLLLTGAFALAAYLTTKRQSSWLETENTKIAEQNEQLASDYAAQQAQLLQDIEVITSVERPQPKQEGWDIVDLTGFPLDFAEGTQVSKSDLYTGGLMVVNALNALPDDYESIIEPQLKSIGKESASKIQVQDFNVRTLPLALDALQRMLSDAAQAGHGDYIVRTGFRSTADQTILFDNQRTKLAEKYSGDILFEKTKERVNVPGTSEYQSGLAVQIGFYNKEDANISKRSINDNDAGKWLLDNAWRYGFVFRFPIEDYPYPDTLDKSNLTGVSIRLSVFRYVGEAAAAVMHLKNFVLEEFVNYMIEYPHIAVYENGALKYEIIREHLGRSIGQIEQIQKPVNISKYETSYDNLEGIISSFIY